MKHCIYILVLLVAAEFCPSTGTDSRPDKPTFQQSDLILAFVSDAEASADYDDLLSKSKLVAAGVIVFNSRFVQPLRIYLSCGIGRTPLEKVALYLRVGNFRL
jgi:hypothetical protein